MVQASPTSSEILSARLMLLTSGNGCCWQQVKLGFATYRSDGVSIESAAKVFGDVTFKRVVFWKNAVVHDVLQMGFNVLFQDVDIVWKQDPRHLHFLRRKPPPSTWRGSTTEATGTSSPSMRIQGSTS